MSMYPRYKDIANFYGNPDVDGDGRPNPGWEFENLVRLPPPYPMVLAWNTKVSVKTIWCHKRIKDPLQAALTNVKKHYGTDVAIRKARMHLFGGCYNFRTMRGSHKLSTHSYAAAIDLDPENNPLGKAWQPGMIPKIVVDIFKEQGAVWGGDWSRPDCQHFQWVRN